MAQSMRVILLSMIAAGLVACGSSGGGSAPSVSDPGVTQPSVVSENVTLKSGSGYECFLRSSGTLTCPTFSIGGI